MEIAESTKNDRFCLLVDDDETSLQLRQGLFDLVGNLRAIPVKDEHEALKEFVAAPGFDLVITDIQLHPNLPHDKSGVLLARQLKEIMPSIPIVGYSAAITENELTDEERSLFTFMYPRGRSKPKEIMKHIVDWEEHATAYKAERHAEARTRLEHFRTKYGQPTPEYSIMRFLVPHRLLQADGDISSVEDILKEAGFELRLIKRGTIRPTVTEIAARLQSPLLIWLHKDLDSTISEVFQYSEFYSFGDSEESAIENLLLLMDGFHRDFKADAPDSKRNMQLKQFLDAIFE